MPKETIIKISKPILKDQTQQEESELEQQEVMTQTQEIEQSQQPNLEPIDIAQPANMRFASTGSSGWKASDILREIRLDSFSMFGAD
ncbi:hypothetical protein BZZ01_07325 [Nostocales cyanobacterium HT-58-2]|nr:hypothetical protein BZZ01_07325 [Nostocales cyanobacterium HT-58-2]